MKIIDYLCLICGQQFCIQNAYKTISGQQKDNRRAMSYKAELTALPEGKTKLLHTGIGLMPGACCLI